MSTQVSYQNAQENLGELCDRVLETGEPVIINRSDGKNVALISEAELSSLLETLYLLRSPANASRLTAALERSKLGTTNPQNIDEVCRRFGLEDDIKPAVSS